VKKVVVTGMGCVSGLGANKSTTWDSLVAGQSAIRPISVSPDGERELSFSGVAAPAVTDARRGPVTAGVESLIGSVGVATSDVAPSGTVRVGKETWTAESDGGPIPSGTTVHVRAVRGVHIVVEPMADDEPDTDQDLADHHPAGAEGGFR
jgi:hypothetical protein